MARDLEEEDLDLDEEEIQEEPALRAGPIHCDNSEGGVGVAARRMGITCQELFRLAYTQKGFTEQYSRGVFVLYVDNNRTMLPPIVFDFCMAIAKAGTYTNKDQCGACVACTMKREAWQGLVSAYRWITPEVTKDTLLGQHPKKATPPPVLDFVETIFQRMLTEGNLDELSEDWKVGLDE